MEQGSQDVIVGMEPTGHYWLNLAHFLREQHVTCAVVNPLHVKKSKELDDNSPTKNDIKDAKVIAQLVKDGRYAVPHLPQGIYAELSEAKKIRDHLSTDLHVVQGRVHNWLDRYFPEFLTVFKDWECKSARQMLSLCLLPHELVFESEEALLSHLRKVAKRGLGIERMSSLNNPLKKMQSLIALCGKLIRILFGVLKKGHRYSEEKMLQDIPRFTAVSLAA